jgi:hypothetical protein
MQEPRLDGNGSLANPVEHVTTPEIEHIDRDSENRSDVVATVATVAVIGIVAAASEAALLPGLFSASPRCGYRNIFRKWARH